VHENDLHQPLPPLETGNVDYAFKDRQNDFLFVLRPKWLELVLELFPESHLEVHVGALHLQAHVFGFLEEDLRVEIQANVHELLVKRGEDPHIELLVGKKPDYSVHRLATLLSVLLALCEEILETSFEDFYANVVVCGR